MELNELKELHEKVESLKLDINRINDIFDLSKNYGISPSNTVEIQITHHGTNDVFKVPVKLHKKIKNHLIKDFQAEIDLYTPALNMAMGVVKKIPYPNKKVAKNDKLDLSLVDNSTFARNPEELLKESDSHKRKNILTMNKPEAGDSLKEAGEPEISVSLAK